LAIGHYDSLSQISSVRRLLSLCCQEPHLHPVPRRTARGPSGATASLDNTARLWEAPPYAKRPCGCSLPVFWPWCLLMQSWSSRVIFGVSKHIQSLLLFSIVSPPLGVGDEALRGTCKGFEPGFRRLDTSYDARTPTNSVSVISLATPPFEF
jgi:hypothetical protein